jgi:hypothetical protein
VQKRRLDCGQETPITVTLIRRSFAALAAFFFVQLTLLGSGTLCALHGAAAGHGTSRGMAASVPHAMTDRHTGIDAPAPDASVLTAVSDVPAAHDGCDASGGPHDCGLPATPGSCAGMTTCAITAAPAVVAASDVPAAASSRDVGQPETLRSGPAAAPELPPPRA